MELQKTIEERYSVRKYKKEQISEQEMQEVLSVLKHSPTALNYQPLRIYDIKSEWGMEQINEASRCIYGAPEVLMVCYDETQMWRNPLIRGHKSGPLDVAIAVDEIMLKAWDMGIGTCCVGLFSDKDLQKRFHLPEYIIPTLLILIGYPADDCKPLAKMHDVSKELSELVFEL